MQGEQRDLLLTSCDPLPLSSLLFYFHRITPLSRIHAAGHDRSLCMMCVPFPPTSTSFSPPPMGMTVTVTVTEREVG